ncbi:hypothetical protein BC828DRAFT_415946 [Blastocladiella britannica]|nr:hypothetical protein BC828DRAFT_415946 [Blastocladiella britannica]
MDILLPDELLVRASTFLELSAIFGPLRGLEMPVQSDLRYARTQPDNPCFLRLSLLAQPNVRDTIIRAYKKEARKLVHAVVHRLVRRPQRNRRWVLRLDTLPKITCDLAHHLDYRLDNKVSPQMALHFVSLIGLANPGWAMAILADNISREGYVQEMLAAMMNFGAPEDDRLDAVVKDIANKFLNLARTACLRLFDTDLGVVDENENLREDEEVDNSEEEDEVLGTDEVEDEE